MPPEIAQQYLRSRHEILWPMDDLLKLEVEAHGGIGRWRQLKVVRAGALITGALWSLKGRPDVLKDIPDWLHSS